MYRNVIGNNLSIKLYPSTGCIISNGKFVKQEDTLKSTRY
ncbi:hypothetical protein PLUTE_b0523 [Pseudoalteromonas luteoviolacea DSM 6061]|nr:hypothetical protein [Pseudoalteromonas luteoviolacea DSM 6061]